MRLARPVVRVLTKDHNTHLTEWRGIERIEDLIARWVYHCLMLFPGNKELTQLVHVLLDVDIHTGVGQTDRVQQPAGHLDEPRRRRTGQSVRTKRQ